MPNLIDELSSAKERRLNQFGTAVLIWCGKHRLVRQGMPHLARRTGVIFLRFSGERGQARGEREVRDTHYALCDTGAAADSDATPLMCRT